MFKFTAVRYLFLARHGESLANQQKVISGQLDSPLSDKGLQQAHWLCEVLQQESLSVIYTSTLSRTIATAKPTADYHSLDIQSVDDLKEIHFGTRQGQAFTAMGDISTLGESAEAYPLFRQRVLDWLDRILATISGNILIVGHRHTNEVILGKLLGLTQPININIKNKYLYKITLADVPSVDTIRLGGEHHGQLFSGLKDV